MTSAQLLCRQYLSASVESHKTCSGGWANSFTCRVRVNCRLKLFVVTVNICGRIKHRKCIWVLSVVEVTEPHEHKRLRDCSPIILLEYLGIVCYIHKAWHLGADQRDKMVSIFNRRKFKNIHIGFKGTYSIRNIIERRLPSSYEHCKCNKREINPLKTKRRLLYLKTQFVPRSKHFSSRL